jgi:CheY-like chemotaxis protein
MIRVLIVDDHTVVRFGLAAIISLHPDMTVAGEASSGEEACALCYARPVDVVLMDLRLPGLSGVDAIRTIRETRPSLQPVQQNLSADADRFQQQPALDPHVQLQRRTDGRVRVHQSDGDTDRAAAQRPNRRAVPVLMATIASSARAAAKSRGRASFP